MNWRSAALAAVGLIGGCSGEPRGPNFVPIEADNLRLHCVGYSEERTHVGEAVYDSPRDAYSTSLRWAKLGGPVIERNAAGEHAYCAEATGETCSQALHNHQLRIDDTTIGAGEGQNAIQRRHTLMNLDLRTATLVLQSIVETFDLPPRGQAETVRARTVVDTNALVACKKVV